MRIAAVLYLVALLCVLLSACSSTDVIELKPAELVDFKSSADIKKRWSEGIGAGQNKRDTLLVPAVDGDRIFASGVKGNVVALERNRGKEQWEVDLDEPVSAGVGVGAGIVLLGTFSGEVLALEQTDGSLRWRTKVSSEVLSAPQTNGDIVVVQTVDGKLHGINASDGKNRWLYDNTLPVLTQHGTATPVVTDTMVIAGFATGKVVALDADDGILKWEQRVAVAKGRTELERMIDVDGSPLLVGDLVYAASLQGRIAAFGRANGRNIWAKEMSSYQNLASGFGNIYVVSETDNVIAYQANNGEKKWENDQLTRRQVSAPQTLGRYLALGDAEGYLHILDQADGQFVARRKIDGDGLRSPMVGDDGTLYILSTGGELTALEILQRDK